MLKSISTYAAELSRLQRDPTHQELRDLIGSLCFLVGRMAAQGNYTDEIEVVSEKLDEAFVKLDDVYVREVAA